MELTVKLPHKSYNLWIDRGNIEKIGTWLSELWQPQQVVVISDQTVASLYGEVVVKQIAAAGFTVSMLTVEPGEASKSFENAMWLYEKLASKGMTRSDGIVVLGGGVIGDLGAFVASTYMRGIHFVQIPTTLLAQVDSSIGGKTAVNTKQAKNLVGTFAQPDGVLIDVGTLTTLTNRQVSVGIAEIVKSAAIADEELWNRLGTFKNSEDLLKNAIEIIYGCCSIKKRVVEEDEFDNNLRLILNFGHTIGHGIENTIGYGVVTHGEAVAIGMVQMSKIAEEKQLTEVGTTQVLRSMLSKFNLPIVLEEWDKQAIFEAITHDKKTRGHLLKIILLEKIGQAKIVSIPTIEVKDFLK